MTSLHRRGLVAAAISTLAAPAVAQPSWPNGPIRLVAPFPTGGSSDALEHFAFRRTHYPRAAVGKRPTGAASGQRGAGPELAQLENALARILQPHLQQALGVPIVVENRTGASGAVGTLNVPTGLRWSVPDHAVARSILAAGMQALPIPFWVGPVLGSRPQPPGERQSRSATVSAQPRAIGAPWKLGCDYPRLIYLMRRFGAGGSGSGLPGLVGGRWSRFASPLQYQYVTIRGTAEDRTFQAAAIRGQLAF